MADLNDDIARYLDGRMSPAEMHALERRALDDPFLADALSGGESIEASEFANDIIDLQQQLGQRVRTAPVTGVTTGGLLEETPRARQASLWSWPTRIAAGLLLLISAGVVLYLIADKDKTAGNLAMKTVEPLPDASSESLTSDSIHSRVDNEPDAKNKQAGQALESSSDKSAAAPLNQPADPARLLKKPGAGNTSKDVSEDASKALAGRVAGVQAETRKPVEDEALSEGALNDGIPTDAEGPPASRAEHRAAEEVTVAKTQDKESNTPDRADADAKLDAALSDDSAERVAQQVSPHNGYSNQRANEPVANPELAKSEYEKGVVAAKRKAAASSAAEAKTAFTGKVVDADGEAIPGVNVVIKGTNTGTVTDINGEYHLVDAAASPTLVYTFIGYTNVEEVADASKPTTVTLSEDLTQLSEVVVAGYGVAKERTPEESTYELATPVGGKRAFKQYLEKNLQYPPEALLNNVEGRVTVTFEVESTGSLRDFQVIKGIGSGCDEEVIRLIKAGPKWTPTRKDEVAEKSLIKVRMRFQLPKKKKK